MKGSLAAATTACAACAIGFVLPRGAATEAWYLAFVGGAGLAMGSLGLLMLGHIFGEAWLDPVRAEAEASARTVPLLLLMALPLTLRLEDLYPWAAGTPGAGWRAVLFQPAFFLARGAGCLVLLWALALWVTHSERPRRASLIGLAVLAAIAEIAIGDWVMSREPLWGAGLFPFAFLITQLLAALAGAIALSLLRGENPEDESMKSLEVTLVVLILLALWTWFTQYLVVWLANLPAEAAWYLRRGGPWLIPLGLAAAALMSALVLLVPVGVGRRTLAVGSLLAVAAHAAFVFWLFRPGAYVLGPPWIWTIPPALALVWAGCFAAIYRPPDIPAVSPKA